MAVLLDREALETALVQVAGAGAVAVGVPPLGVGHGQPLHERRQSPVALGARAPGASGWASGSSASSPHRLAAPAPGPAPAGTRRSRRRRRTGAGGRCGGSSRGTPGRRGRCGACGAWPEGYGRARRHAMASDPVSLPLTDVTKSVAVGPRDKEESFQRLTSGRRGRLLGVSGRADFQERVRRRSPSCS